MSIQEITEALGRIKHSAWFMSPWHVEEDASAVRNSDDFSYICNASSDDFAAYIASVNPPAVIELISEINRLRNKVSARALTDRQLADEIEAVDDACKGGFERKRRELENQAELVNATNGARDLPYDRDTLGRFVREAWVRWAESQPEPKPSWLLPYDELSEADKEADRQIGEALARWTLIGDAARNAAAE